MKRILLAAAITLIASGAYAQDTTCKASASEKRLAGAALKSFMTKCERDAKSTCEADSKSKKLAGAAKNSHVKKCVTDAVGT
jgi:uncharacterized membrane protein